MPHLTEFFKLVSNETRLRMIILLAQEDLYVCQISGILDLSQPMISRHLSKLKDLNYVCGKRKGKYILYSLNLNDNIIENLVQNITENIERYPILNEDKRRLRDKNIHLSKCKSKLPK